jgi:NAD(P)-dependent dehydrogenase (short-subunit alcohol dehydrogenase family)
MSALQRGSILLTGANGGLGSAIVAQVAHSQDLALHYHGIYTVRRAATATVLNGILAQPASRQHAHSVVEVDLSRLSSVRAAAEDINRRVADGSIPPIRALVLNAGWQEQTTQTFSDDGLDMTFQANYLGHWLLTLLLLQSMDKNDGRIVFVGSQMHEYVSSFIRREYPFELLLTVVKPS